MARAWVDPEFRARLLADAVGAVAEYQQQRVPLAVLQDTPTVHHVIVCTLCSCYPSGILGNPPTWYKSFEYRSRVVREPRAVLAEFGMDARARGRAPRARLDGRAALPGAAAATGRHGRLGRRPRWPPW